MNSNSAKSVAVLMVVNEDNWCRAAVNLADIRRQRDVQAHAVVLDQTDSGIGAIDGASVVRVNPEASYGDAIREGLKRTPANLIALSIPGIRMLPNRLVRQRAELSINQHIDLVTSNLVLLDSAGHLAAEANPQKAQEAPTPFWQAGVMLRRRALGRMGRSADLPVDLFLYLKLRSEGRTGHMDAVFSVASQDEFNARIEGSLEDALAVRSIRPPIGPRTDRWADERVRFDKRLSNHTSVSDALDRMIRDGSFNR
jgi:hypothetical protein